MSNLLSPEEQARLRAAGLLAEPWERWTHSSNDGFHLQAVPRNFDARRQRSDRMTTFDQINRKSTTKSTTPYRKAGRR